MSYDLPSGLGQTREFPHTPFLAGSIHRAFDDGFPWTGRRSHGARKNALNTPSRRRAGKNVRIGICTARTRDQPVST